MGSYTYDFSLKQIRRNPPNKKNVQEEKARRASLSKTAAAHRAKREQEKEKSKYSSKFALSDIMVCKECGQPYRRQVWSKYGQKSAVLMCLFDNILITNIVRWRVKQAEG